MIFQCRYVRRTGVHYIPHFKSWKEQKQILLKFHEKRINSSKKQIILDLKELAKLKFTNPTTAGWRRNRKKQKIAKYRRCQVCHSYFARCYHHIIMIFNGGYDKRLNRLRICFYCHSDVHPWLKTARGSFQSSFRGSFEHGNSQ